MAKRRPNEVVLSHCWSHVRRDFMDLSKEGLTPIATEALQRIAQFYEAEIRGCKTRRPQVHSSGQNQAFDPRYAVWLEESLQELPGRLPTAGVIRYALNHWDGLTRVLDDGRIELDTNSVERAIRPIVLNRKNALFAGGDEGGKPKATIATLIECCKLQDVESNAYLTDVLTRLVNGNLQRQLSELTPWAWKAADPPR